MIDVIFNPHVSVQLLTGRKVDANPLFVVVVASEEREKHSAASEPNAIEVTSGRVSNVFRDIRWRERDTTRSCSLLAPCPHSPRHPSADRRAGSTHPPQEIRRYPTTSQPPHHPHHLSLLPYHSTGMQSDSGNLHHTAPHSSIDASGH